MKYFLEKAYKAWCGAATLRQRRTRYKNYTYGDQWCDPIPDRHGNYVREDEIINASGAVPLKNNLIRQLVKTVVGRFRSQAAEASLYNEKSIALLARENSLGELDSRMLEEFLISGCAIQRICHERRRQGLGTWVDNVALPRFFVNTFRDPRGWDIDLVGMLHDMTLAEVVNRFGGGDSAKAKELTELYRGLGAGTVLTMPAELGEGIDDYDFFTAPEGYCRVVEVWSFDSRPSESTGCYDFVWHCRWYAPDGTLLSEYDSPYKHGSHPFVLKFYPLTDGEVHSFVEDVIDQQRYINRLIVMIDKMMSTSAKGVLLFPVDRKVSNISWAEIVDTWAHSDGVIPICGGDGPLPQQVITNTGQSGAYQLLELQMKLFEDISGVGDALLGRTNTSARGVEMFDTQVRNATIALADIFDTFTAFTQQRNSKALSTAK